MGGGCCCVVVAAVVVGFVRAFSWGARRTSGEALGQQVGARGATPAQRSRACRGRGATACVRGNVVVLSRVEVVESCGELWQSGVAWRVCEERGGPGQCCGSGELG